MSKILDINGSLQTPNIVFKSDVDNSIKQITDRANNIAFSQPDVAKRPIYNYGDGEPYAEFDGVDDYIEDSKTNRFPLIGAFTVQFWIYFDSLGTYTPVSTGHSATEWGLTLLTNDLRLYYGGAAVFSTGANSIVAGQWYHVSYQQSAINRQTFLNGVLANTELAYATPMLSGKLRFGNSVLGYATPMRLKNFKIYDKNLVPLTETVLGIQVFDPKESFTYYKRFQNKDNTKKLFLTSRNLKDVVIDSSNKIEKIYSEIGSHYFEQLTPANQPTYTNKGILFASGESLSQTSSDVYNFGTDDFILNKKINFQNESVAFEVGSGIIKFGLDATNAYIETSGGKLYATRSHAINEGYKDFSLIRISGIIYFLIDGILENSRTESVNYNTDQSAKIGGLFIGDFDDLLNSHAIIFNPTGFSNGQKVFEPPRRRSLDDTIIQYPIP